MDRHEEDEMETTAVYARVSQDRGEATSIEEQLAEIAREADRRGWSTGEPYVDRGISASRPGTKRPAYLRLLEDIRAGRVTRLLVYMTDRLYRQPRELEDLIDLVEGRAVTIGTVRSGELDLSTPEGRAFARNAAVWNKLETEKTSERVRRNKRVARSEGRWLGGGRRPYGYRYQDGRWTRDRAEAKVLRDVARRVVAGESLNRVAADLNSRGVTTAGGGRWRPQHLKRMLIGRDGRDRPFAAGGEDWPAILTRDEVELLRARLTVASKYRPKELARGRRYPLTGLVVCAECGTKMVGSGGFYRCTQRDGGCGRIGVKALDLEQHLMGQIQALREHGHVRDDGAPSPVVVEVSEELLAELRDTEARLLEIGDAVADGKLSVMAAGRAEQRLEERRRALQEQVAAAVPAPRNGYFSHLVSEEAARESEEWRQRWETGTLTDIEVRDLRDEFGDFVERVLVQPRPDRRKSFNPARVQIEWRP